MNATDVILAFSAPSEVGMVLAVLPPFRICTKLCSFCGPGPFTPTFGGKKCLFPTASFSPACFLSGAGFCLFTFISLFYLGWPPEGIVGAARIYSLLRLNFVFLLEKMFFFALFGLAFEIPICHHSADYY